MDFNITTALIGLGILVVCLIPLLWLHYTSHKANKNLETQFKEAASKVGINISLSDTWSKMYSIGVDETSRKLFYTKLNGNGLEPIQIDLSNMKSCTIAKEMDGSNLEKIHLTIQLKNEPQQKLEFYDSDILPSISEEYLLAEKWLQNIQRII